MLLLIPSVKGRRWLFKYSIVLHAVFLSALVCFITCANLIVRLWLETELWSSTVQQFCSYVMFSTQCAQGEKLSDPDVTLALIQSKKEKLAGPRKYNSALQFGKMDRIIIIYLWVCCPCGRAVAKPWKRSSFRPCPYKCNTWFSEGSVKICSPSRMAMFDLLSSHRVPVESAIYQACFLQALNALYQDEENAHTQWGFNNQPHTICVH